MKDLLGAILNNKTSELNITIKSAVVLIFENFVVYILTEIEIMYTLLPYKKI